jgi:ElaB/YqjD/DUF883 family membrane-anchored ribosome-binding protein
MESSDFTTNASNAGASDGMGGTTGTNGSSGGDGSMNTAGSIGATSTADDSGLADKAGQMLGSAKDKLSDAGSSVKDRASSAKDSLVSALESGAEKLRQRSGDGSLAGAGAMGGTTAVADDRMSQVSTRVAGGMEATADWLREADLDGLKASVEKQVKEHPGRTLLVAVGVGYLLGKALRK